MRRIAGLLLVDPRGWLLLQERDEHAPRAPEKWGLVGGHVEDDEDFEQAAYRELAEETGVVLAPGQLRLWREETFTGAEEDPGTYRLYTARVDLTDDDIVLGEGRRIVFVAPRDVPRLDRSESCAHFTEAFLGSPAYRELVTAGDPA